MKKIVKILSLILALTLAFSVTACGNSDDSNKDYESVSIFYVNGNYIEGHKRDEVWRAIEDSVKVNMNFSGASSGNYETVLYPMLNTGDFPDIVFMVANGQNTAYMRYADQDEGIFWDIEELIELAKIETGSDTPYPYIQKAFNSNQYKPLMYNGYRTLIPAVNVSSGWGIYWRADWLINVGYYDMVDGQKVAHIPQTIEEFTEACWLFTYADPDGNGKNDTFGFAPGSKSIWWNPLYHAFGVSVDFDYNETTGNVEYFRLTDKFNTFLKYANFLYNSGIIDPNFNTNNANQERDKFINGQCGVIITNANGHVPYILNPFEQRNGKDKVVMGYMPVGSGNVGNGLLTTEYTEQAKTEKSLTSAMTGDNGIVYGEKDACGMSDWGLWYGGYSISKSCANPYKALELLNFLMSPEGCMLKTYGIEGVHYTLGENGKVTYTAENLANREKLPSGRFATSFDENNNAIMSGSYILNALMGTFWDWENFDTTNEVAIKQDFESISLIYADIIEDAENKLVYAKSKLTYLMDVSQSVVEQRNKIADFTNIEISNIIRGSMGQHGNQATFEYMLEYCENTQHLSQVCQAYKTAALKHGII